jgi:hypothetical protein
MAEQSNVTVYGLASSHDSVIRYIGQTTTSLAVRRERHLSWVRRKRDSSRRATWIRAVLRAGHHVIIVELEANATLHVSEQRWIADYRTRTDLVNGTTGGDGCIGVPKTAAHCAAISAALKGRSSPWTAERNRAGKAHTGRVKPWVAEHNAARVWTPEARQKLGEANRRLSDDQVRAIKRLMAQGRTQVSIAADYNVSTSLISQIKRGKKYPDIV